jgi:transposase
VIPPKQSSEFVARMEVVLDVYKRPYDKDNPVICMDETPKQLIGEARIPIPHSPGTLAKHDYEYKRNGVCNIFMASEPLNGKRYVQVTEYKKKDDWAVFMKSIADKYKDASKITLVMDNYGTHTMGSFYEVFPPEVAKALIDRFEFIYTPKHGSWLNMAEIELNVMQKQCLNRRIPDIEILEREVDAWTRARNNKKCQINWQFTTQDSRTKLKRLYPTIDA